MKVTCLNFAGVEVCTQRAHGKVCLAGTRKCRDLEETEQLKGEEAVPGGRQEGARYTFSEWSLPFRTSGSKGLFLK